MRETLSSVVLAVLLLRLVLAVQLLGAVPSMEEMIVHPLGDVHMHGKNHSTFYPLMQLSKESLKSRGDAQECFAIRHIWPEFIEPTNRATVPFDRISNETQQAGITVRARALMETTRYWFHKGMNKIEITLHLDAVEQYLHVSPEKPLEKTTVIDPFCAKHSLNANACQMLADSIQFYQTIHQIRKDRLDCRSFDAAVFNDHGIRICLQGVLYPERNILDKPPAVDAPNVICQPFNDEVVFRLDLHGSSHLFLRSFIRGAESIATTSQARISVLVRGMNAPSRLEITNPRRGATVSRHTAVDLTLHAAPDFKNTGKMVCLSHDMVSYACSEMYANSVTVPFEVPIGMPYIAAVLMDRETSLINFEEVNFDDALVQVEVVDDKDSIYQHSRSMSMVLVTGCDESYVVNNRLQNLVGSIHRWEPNTKIHLYDLGLSLQSKEMIQKWKNVQVMEVPFHRLPVHFSDLGTYSFKPWALYNSLNQVDFVVWIDANMELRRPLDEMRSILQKKGVFYTVQRPKFPTRYHYPQVVRSLNCKAEMESRPQGGAGLQGYAKGSWAYKNVLLPLLHCAHSKDCIAPDGTSKQNHRQDQTVLNSILCASNYSDFEYDKKWWLSSHYEDAIETLQPTADETDFNDMVIYTRRDHVVKPYVKHLRLSSV